MKECWINIYERHGQRWLGNPKSTKYLANAISNKWRIYLIHIRMKQ